MQTDSDAGKVVCCMGKYRTENDYFTGVVRAIGHQGDGKKKGDMTFMYEGTSQAGEPIGFGRMLKYDATNSQAIYNSGF
jgi:hypothetical protein